MKVRWGIVGLGQMAQCFAEANKYVNNSELFAVASTDKGRLNEFAHNFDIAKKYAFQTYTDLICCDEVDAVYIALTNNLHFEMIMKCMEFQKHVLVEKPATQNAKEMVYISEKINKGTTLFAEGFAYLYHPATKRYLEMIKDGLIGQPISLNTRFGFEILSDKQNFIKRVFKKEGRHFNQKLGGGCILDLGCYLTSISRVVAGIAFKQDGLDLIINKSKKHFGTKKVEIDATCEILFNSKLTSSLHASFNSDLGQKTIITGTEGEIVINNTWSCQDNGFFYNGVFQKIDRLVYDNVYSYQIHSISDWILNNKLIPEFPSHSYNETLSNMQILDKWKRS